MNNAGIPSNFCIVCWRGEVALSPLVQKNEKSSLYNQMVSAGKNLGKEIFNNRSALKLAFGDTINCTRVQFTLLPHIINVNFLSTEG